MQYFRKFPTVEGFDTESYKGNILLITTSTDYKEPKTFEEILNFLWYHGEQLNFFYNINFDFSIILKPYLLTKTKKDLGDLLKFHTVNYGEFELSFVGSKGFHISVGKRKKYYFDISGFYNDGKFYTLDEVAKAVLGTGKNNEELEIDRVKIGSEPGYYIKNRDKIIKYGIKDAELTKRLAIEKIKSVYNSFGFYSKKWYSVASISKAYLDHYHKDEKWQFWKLIDGDIDAFETIYFSYFGGIFTTKTIGYIQKANKIDINSAYPDAFRNLTSIRDGKIKRVNTVSDCDYGFYKVRLKYNGLIPYRKKNGALFYPISANPLETYMTKLEYDFWKDKTEIEIIYGYQIYTKGIKEFTDFADIYEIRKEIKHSKKLDEMMHQYNLKIIMNASYGATAESKMNFTYWSNFIYASYITAYTRIKIYEAIEKLPNKEFIAILTDSIVYEGEADIKTGKELGEWDLELKESPAVFYMNGMYFTDGHLKKRGFAKLKIEDLRGSNQISIKRLKIRKILEGIIQEKIEEIGDFKYETKILSLLPNTQRYIFPVDKLSFDYLNNNKLVGQEIIVSENPESKPYNKQKLLNIMHREKKARKGIWVMNKKKVKNEY